MNGVQDTSIFTFQNIQHTLGEKQALIIKSLQFKGATTNLELSVHLGWPINQVTPRTNELVKKGIVKMSSKRECKISGRMAIAWMIKT